MSSVTFLIGHLRLRSMLGYLALPMSVGSVLGAIVGGDLATWSPTTLLRMIFAVILAVSAAKLLAAKPKLRLNALQTPLFAYSQRLKTEIVRNRLNHLRADQASSPVAALCWSWSRNDGIAESRLGIVPWIFRDVVGRYHC